MSSRRGAGEDNILAMLERDSARRPGTRMSGVRLASYGAAAALAGILAGGVAWLAYDNHTTSQELQAQHDAATRAAPTVLADASPPPLPPPSPGASPAVEAPRTAVIVDESVHRPDAPAASTVPPLVMLPPHELKGAKPTPTPTSTPTATSTPAPTSAPTPISTPTPTPPAPRLVREVAPPAAARSEAVQATPAKSAPSQAAPRIVAGKKSDKAAKPANRKAKATPARTTTAAKARAEATARTRKAAPGAGAPVDSDVALISAIISQADRHRGERDAASSCSGAKCPPAKAARP